VSCQSSTRELTRSMVYQRRSMISDIQYALPCYVCFIREACSMDSPNEVKAPAERRTVTI
jgi:hypothetical protein